MVPTQGSWNIHGSSPRPNMYELALANPKVLPRGAQTLTMNFASIEEGGEQIGGADREDRLHRRRQDGYVRVEQVQGVHSL